MKIEQLLSVSATTSGVELPTEDPGTAPEFSDALESLAQYSDVPFGKPEVPVDQIVIQNPHAVQTTDQPVPFANMNASDEHLPMNAAGTVAVGKMGQNGTLEMVRNPNATQVGTTDLSSTEAEELSLNKMSVEPSAARDTQNIIHDPGSKASRGQSPNPTLELSHQDAPNTFGSLRQNMQIPATTKVSRVKQGLAPPIEKVTTDLGRSVTQLTVVDDSLKTSTTGTPTPDVSPPNSPVQVTEPDFKTTIFEKQPSAWPSPPTTPEAAPQEMVKLARRTNTPPVIETTTHQTQPVSPATEPQTSFVDAAKTKGPEVSFVANSNIHVTASPTQPLFIDNSPKSNGTIIEIAAPETVTREQSFGPQSRRTMKGMYRSVEVAKTPQMNNAEIPKATEAAATFVDKLPDPSLIPDIAMAEVQVGQTASARTNMQPLVAPPEFTPQVIKTIAEAAVNLQDCPVELTLNPEELGRVRLTLQNNDGNMSVAVSVERPETLDLLRRHIDMLANQLREIGYKEISFEFSSRENSFAENDASQQDDQPDTTSEPVPDQVPAPVRISLAGPGRVDIRL